MEEVGFNLLHDNQEEYLMKSNNSTGRVSRRTFLKLAGGGLLAAGGVGFLRKFISPELVALAQMEAPDRVFAATDGWMYLPPLPTPSPYHPDDLSPDPSLFTTYIFGFRDVTGQTDEQILNQKMKAQHSAPMFWIDENQQFRLELRNLGLLSQRIAESVTLVTALNPLIGYEKAAAIANTAIATGKPIALIAEELGIMSEAELLHLLLPENLTRAGALAPPATVAATVAAAVAAAAVAAA